MVLTLTCLRGTLDKIDAVFLDLNGRKVAPGIDLEWESQQCLDISTSCHCTPVRSREDDSKENCSPFLQMSGCSCAA